MNKQTYQALSREFREQGLPHEHPLYDHFAEIETVLYRDELLVEDVPQSTYCAVSEAYRFHICFLIECWSAQEHERRLDYLDAWGWA